MEPSGASDRAPGEVDLPEELPAVIRPSAHPLMKTMLKAVLLLACVLFVGAMVRMQHCDLRRAGDAKPRPPRRHGLESPSRAVRLSRFACLQDRATDTGDEDMIPPT